MSGSLTRIEMGVSEMKRAFKFKKKGGVKRESAGLTWSAMHKVVVVLYLSRSTQG